MSKETLEEALAQALEEALVGVYEQDREMFDADALAAVETLILLWQPGEETAESQALSYWAYAAYEAMAVVCEFFAGHEIPYDVEEVALAHYTYDDDAPLEILSGSEITGVLFQLRRSLEHWQEGGGLRSFYESIRE
jgi:hypothetical protein